MLMCPFVLLRSRTKLLTSDSSMLKLGVNNEHRTNWFTLLACCGWLRSWRLVAKTLWILICFKAGTYSQIDIRVINVSSTV